MSDWLVLNGGRARLLSQPLEPYLRFAHSAKLPHPRCRIGICRDLGMRSDNTLWLAALQTWPDNERRPGIRLSSFLLQLVPCQPVGSLRNSRVPMVIFATKLVGMATTRASLTSMSGLVCLF